MSHGKSLTQDPPLNFHNSLHPWLPKKWLGLLTFCSLGNSLEVSSSVITPPEKNISWPQVLPGQYMHIVNFFRSTHLLFWMLTGAEKAICLADYKHNTVILHSSAQQLADDFTLKNKCTLYQAANNVNKCSKFQLTVHVLTTSLWVISSPASNWA